MPRRRIPPHAQQLGVPQADDAETQVRNLLAETQALSARLAALNEVAAAMQSSLDTQTVLATLAREARWVIDFQYCSVTEIDDTGLIERVLVQPVPGESSLHWRDTDRGPVGRAVRAGHALLLSSLEGEADVPADMGAALILPLRSRGIIIGTLNFFARQPGHYRLDDMRIAAALAAQAAVVIQNTHLFREVAAARDELHTILESISDGVIVVGAYGDVLLINRAARQLLGLPKRPLVGCRLSRLALVARTAQGRRLLGRGQLIGLASALMLDKPGTLRTSDGGYLEWRRTPLRESAEQPGQVLAIRNITDRVRLDELRDDLIAMLVHDLRTPLSSMMLGLDMMNYLNDDPTLQRELQERMRLSVNQMLRQVNTLLDLRKLEAGKLALERRSGSLRTIFEQVRASFATHAEYGAVQLSLCLSPDMPFLTIDHELIRRVLENLVGNALKFTDSGGKIDLVANYMPETAQVTVQVCDTGSGIVPELREHIFEKFAQTSEGRRRTGTGLGLTFCKLVVEAHGGQIGVGENPGGGSIFWFSLPL